MTPEEYREKWKAYEVKRERGELLFGSKFVYWKKDETRSVSSNSQQFLTQYGMPASAAPFLTFSTKQPITGLIDPKFFQIGGEGGGNPIVIGPKGNVLWLEHETGFVDSFLINSSLPQFAECLLIVADSIRRRNAGGEDLDVLYEQTLDKLCKVDRASNDYWSAELGSLFDLEG